MAITARQLESLRSSLSPGVVARARAYLRAVQIVEADAAHVAAIVTGSIEYDVRI